jgi:hypothetical protein
LVTWTIPAVLGGVRLVTWTIPAVVNWCFDRKINQNNMVKSANPTRRTLVLVVAVQVAFERQALKPVSHLIGYRLWV